MIKLTILRFDKNKLYTDIPRCIYNLYCGQEATVRIKYGETE